MSDSIDTLLYDTETETALRESVRGLLAARCHPSAVTGTYDGDHAAGTRLWTCLARELGVAGLLVPEDRGGAGGCARDAAVVLEELGRFVAPVPFLTSSVIAATVLLADESDLLEALSAGASTVALLAPFTAAEPAQVPSLRASPDRRLTGHVRSVAGALEADVLLASVETRTGTEIYAVAATAARISPVISLDMTRPLADVTLDRAPARLVVRAESGGPALRAGLSAGAALLAAEQTGIAARCLDTTVEYLTTRRQFGRIVGGFQSVKHRLADLFVEVETASATARYAAGALSDPGAEADIATAVAAAHCADVAVHAAEEAVQLHGGIGMTWEYPVHLYLKRAKADQIALGGPGHHRAVLGELIDLEFGRP